MDPDTFHFICLLTYVRKAYYVLGTSHFVFKNRTQKEQTHTQTSFYIRKFREQA